MKKTVLAVFLLVAVFLTTGIASAAGSSYETARKLYYSGKYKEAVKYLRDYIDQKPDPAAYYMMGYSLYKLHRFDEANEYFRDAYLIDPSFSPIKPGMAAEHQARPRKARAAAAATADSTAAVQKPAAKETVASAPAGQDKKVASAPQPADQKKPEPAKPEAAKQAPAAAAAPQHTQTSTPSAPAVSVTPAPATPAPGTPTTPATPQPSVPVPMPKKIGPEAGVDVAMPLLMGGLFAGGILLVFLGIGLAVYLFFSYCMYRIATKLNCPAPWTAWVPLLNMWAVVGSAGKPWWWILLMFVPLPNFFVIIYLWMCISENLGKNRWLGILIMVPIANIIYMVMLAFSKDEHAALSTPSTDELE